MTNHSDPFQALADADKPKPNFFIVGAPKCGTTSLHEYLQRHPDVFMPYYKEPHFFGTDLHGSRFRQFRRQPQKYLKLFRDVRREKRIGESSPWYLVSERAAREIHSYNPNANIIIMLRNPVDMMYSMWSQFRYSGNEQIESFEEALAAEAQRREGKRIRRAAHCITGLYYRRMTRFSEQIQRYLDCFGEDQVMIIIFDDFRADTPGVYRAVLEFLELDTAVDVQFGIRNPNKEVRLAWLQKLIIGAGFSLMLLKDRLTFLATTSRLVPYKYRTQAVEGVIAAYTRYERRSPLTAETRQRLANDAAPEIDALSNLLNRDLSHWYTIEGERRPAERAAPPPTTVKRNGRRQLIVRLLSILVTVALLSVLVGEVRWDDFDQLLGRVAPLSWLGALLAYLALNLFRALRFRVLLDKGDTPWRLLAPITLYHNFLVRALPFKLGELSYIALLRSRLQYSMEEGMSSLFGARVLELLIIVMVFAGGILTTAETFAAQHDQLFVIITITFLLCMVALYFGGALIRALLIRLRPVLARLLRTKRDLLALIESRALQLAGELDRIRQPRLFVTALFISCFTYSSSFLTNYILLRALGITVDLSAMIAIISIGMFASAFPLNVSGFGVVEGAWRVALVQFADWNESDATATGFLLHGFQLFAAALYGLAGYLLIQLSPRPPAQNDAPTMK